MEKISNIKVEEALPLSATPTNHYKIFDRVYFI